MIDIVGIKLDIGVEIAQTDLISFWIYKTLLKVSIIFHIVTDTDQTRISLTTSDATKRQAVTFGKRTNRIRI